VWSKDFEAHQRIVDLVKEGQGEVAEAYVQRLMGRFALTAYDNWEKKPADSNHVWRRTASASKKKTKR
jgi:DNA-binding GntR family transcriptional regulator